MGSLVAAVEVIPAAAGTQGVVDTSTRETAATPAELAAITADEVTLAIAATIEDIPEVAAIMVGAPIIMADVVTATLDTTAGAATMVVITQVARITESAVYSWDITGSLMGMPTSQGRRFPRMPEGSGPAPQFGGRRIRCGRNNMSAKALCQSPRTCHGLCGATLDFGRPAVSAVRDGGFLS